MLVLPLVVSLGTGDGLTTQTEKRIKKVEKWHCSALPQNFCFQSYSDLTLTCDKFQLNFTSKPINKPMSSVLVHTWGRRCGYINAHDRSKFRCDPCMLVCTVGLLHHCSPNAARTQFSGPKQTKKEGEEFVKKSVFSMQRKERKLPYIQGRELKAHVGDKKQNEKTLPTHRKLYCLSFSELQKAKRQKT